MLTILTSSVTPWLQGALAAILAATGLGVSAGAQPAKQEGKPAVSSTAITVKPVAPSVTAVSKKKKEPTCSVPTSTPTPSPTVLPTVPTTPAPTSTSPTTPAPTSTSPTSASPTNTTPAPTSTSATPTPTPTTSSPTPTATEPTRSPGWVDGWGEPAFEDNFDGTAVNTSKWRVRNDDYMSYDWAIIKSSNVTVKDGTVTLSTNKLDTPVIKSDKRVRDYSSAYMDTIGKFSQSYGRFEVRAKLPTVKDKSKGIWPAFWLRPSDGGDGEIDIFEAYGTPTTKTFDTSRRTEATIHYNYTDANRKKSGWTPTSIDVNDGKFHTWTVEWDSSKMVFKVDGKEYFTSKSSDDARWAKAFGSNRTYDIRMNVQVGSDYWGQPDDANTAKHTDYVVDYVRAWSK